MSSLKDRVRRGILVCGTLVTINALVGYGATAMAQEPQPQQPPQEQQDQAQEQPRFEQVVEVTGSLIPRPTLEAMSPVTTLDPEEITTAGTTRIEDLLTSLPQVFASQNSTLSNNSTGTATVDLRYLGSQRTLVLIDGRRMPSGDIYDVAPDLNFIPSALVKRVDVLTGGASSVYGADAVAGVVNFIIDRDFEGLKAGIFGSGYQHNNNNALAQRINEEAGYTAPSGGAWDGGAFDAYMAYGAKFADGKAHASMYIDYRQTSALLKNRRDYTNCSVLGGLGEDGPSCGGSYTSPTGDFYTPDNNMDWTLDTTGPGNTFRPFELPNDLFNYGAVNFMQRPDVRWVAGGFFDYTWSERLQGYMSVMFMDDVTDAQIAPSGDFFVTNYINCDNPMLSDDQRQKVCTDLGYGPNDMAPLQIGRRNVEGGPRNNHLEHVAYRLVAGLKGTLSEVWSYDVYGLHAQVHAPAEYQNDLNVNNLQDALIVDGDPADPSTWVCRSGNAGCVPWNIFQVNGVTQEALAYLVVPLIYNSGTRTDVMSGKVNGDLGVKIPSATESLQLALGAEYRKESLFFDPDYAYQQFLGAGQGGPLLPVSGTYDVKEGYLEALVPVVQDVKGAQNLSFELGYRYSDYSNAGGYSTWKVQGSYAPSKSFKIRAGVNRATRAPNIVELYTPQGLGLNGATDPCAGPTPAYSQEQCAYTGVTADQYGLIRPNPAQQYNTFGGGNPDLAPEIADTHYAGLVITPSSLPGLSLAFDYYDIEIDDTIGNLNADDILKQCAVTGNPDLCSLIHRDAQGSLWASRNGYTVTLNSNVGKLGSEGLDFNGSYLLPVGDGFLNFSIMGTYTMARTVDTGLYNYDCVGLFGNQCGIPTAKWRHRARVAWETGPWVVTLGWRMNGAVKVDESSTQDALYNPDDIPLWKANGSYEYGAYHYFDLGGTYNVSKGIQVALGINNIADKEPPLGVGFSTNDYGTGFYGFYDAYGRVIHGSIQFNF